ncbi:unnamed protein product [Choristocarpus tenellus]
MLVTAPIQSIGGVYQALACCQRLSEEFTSDNRIRLKVMSEVGQVEDVIQRIQDATRGAAVIDVQGP